MISYASFTWNANKYDTLFNAMKSLKYPNIIIVGKKDERSITFSITDVDIKTTTFKSKINLNAPVGCNFTRTIDKATFLNIVSGSIKEFTINLYEKILHFKGKSDICDIDYIYFWLNK